MNENTKTARAFLTHWADVIRDDGKELRHLGFPSTSAEYRIWRMALTREPVKKGEIERDPAPAKATISRREAEILLDAETTRAELIVFIVRHQCPELGRILRAEYLDEVPAHGGMRSAEGKHDRLRRDPRWNETEFREQKARSLMISPTTYWAKLDAAHLMVATLMLMRTDWVRELADIEVEKVLSAA